MSSSPSLLASNMTSFTSPTSPLFHAHLTGPPDPHRFRRSPAIRASFSGQEENQHQQTTHRRKLVGTLLSTAVALGLHGVAARAGMAESWGTRSFIRERFFEPGLSPEDAVARIRQTAEGLHGIRDMLEAMSWRYVLFYIRLKQAYLSQDMKNAMSMVPEFRRESYVKTANELVDNMAEFDFYVRTPKVYESYLYYEKTLKSIDELVALLA
ncbi:photosynthetic NDH subunit of lumenal location 2, chloroplastic [Diospyros lotus]|uniref:photosynthetic NDH subunit of lumenal location 2, chloroplastic n=1 Tax=Diospyros lotus TaxID=55363 RepID=UPI002252C3F0|nr:photosynthetic NDH subunit of lumenal location 2, chloroplastic [Diospyros lotus]